MESILNAPYVENDKLEACGEAAARLLPREGEIRSRRMLPAIRSDLREIRRCCALLQKRSAAGEEPPTAWAWLLDNEYLARREGLSALGDLGGGEKLRRTAEGPLILALARSLLLAGRGEVTEERAARFLAGFQRVTPLRRGELRRFPAALRLAVLDELARLCTQLSGSREPEAFAAGLEALFTTLRLFAVLDTEELLTGADLCHAILSRDPAGVFPRMDADSRRDYLDRLGMLARRRGQEEPVCAAALLREAEEKGVHVGELLFSPPRDGLARLCTGFTLLGTLVLSLLLAFSRGGPPAALLLLIPVWQLVKDGLDLLLSRLCPRRRLPRMDLKDGVPPEGRTLCVISALLFDEAEAKRLCRRLEEERMAARREGPELLFGLLADLPEAPAETMPGDAAILKAAQAGIAGLNAKYGGGFTLFTRPRRFDGQSWTGFERKRGALLELAALCAGEQSALRVTGEAEALRGVRFLLTLDSDSRLSPGAAGELIAAMLHPLNRPQLDGKTGLVSAGHGVIQPRLVPEPESARATDFALVFAGPGGSDPYGGLWGQGDQDAFGSCGFAGKGILDLRALLQVTAGRIPPGRVLSHDAVEGALLRGGYVGEAECADRFPAKPLAYYKRLHRWVRGDWQNLSFAFSRALPEAARRRLRESLLRSLLPPVTLLAILAGFLLPGSSLVIAAWAALLALLDRLFLSFLAESRRRSGRERRFSRLLTGAGGAIVQTFLRLWLLPYEAWICLSALLTALWRMVVSHKKLLQWQTAAQAERGRGGLSACLRAFLPAQVPGLLCLLLSPGILGRAAGLMWLLSPAAAYALSLPARKGAFLSSRDREELLELAEKSFRYYRDFCREEDHFLPPDNFQEQPPVGLAHRSSPTNIGMAMASAVAAEAMGFCPRQEALALLSRITDTLELLPRFRGHFYNWYDTRSLAPLLPAHLSTVDSGNLCAALIAVEQALLSWGEEALAARLRVLSEEMDFSLLYDPRRDLFYISYDTEQARGTGGWYDLLACEAMLTSFLAVARGQAPLKHWRRLGRGLLQKDGYRGLASWTGTMFEYLMPALFLPLIPGSLLQESARFCLYVQKRRRFPGKPWGISESAYYALDPGLSYRYKASGCAELALKRGQDEDLVTAPYAAFLALAVDPAAAVQDLRLFRRWGALGPQGFYDAVDFTPSRCREEEGQIVRCTMAHHVGMSLAAAANCLCGGLLRELFLRDPAMAACLPLLQERMPEGVGVLRRDLSRAPEKPPRDPERWWSLSGGREDAEDRRCLLSNGAWDLLLHRDGRSCALYRGLAVYGRPGLERGSPLLSLFWRGGEQPGPAEAARWELSESRGLWSWEEDGLLCRLEVSLPAGEIGERRCLQLHALAAGEGELRLELAPLLAPLRDYDAQPTYWSTGLEAEEAGAGALLLHRLGRGGVPSLWLCLQAGEGASWRFDGTARLRLPFRLEAGRTGELRLAFCLGESRERALAGAARLLEDGSRADLVGALALRLGMSGAELGKAMGLLSQLYRPLHGAAPRRELWPWGISGDLPLLLCDGASPEALPLLRRFLLLKSCGQEADLAYLTDEQGEYRQPLRRELSRLLSGWGLEALLEARGGIHFVPSAARETLLSRAGFCPGETLWRFSPPGSPVLSAPRTRGTVPAFAFAEESFSFAASPLPARVWQLPLSNGRLGAIAADCGPAALWLDNARELPLTLPMEDPRASQPPELLWAETGDGPVSLFAAEDGHPCRVIFAPGRARWEKELAGRTVVTELFLPPWQDARLLLIRGAEGLELHWQLRPLLAPTDASSLRCRFSEGLFRAENPESGREGLRFLAGCSVPCGCRTDFTPPAMLLRLECDELTVLGCGCCTEAELRQLLRPGAALSALADARSQWQRLLGERPRPTGDPSLDRLLWPWAPYQALACRLMGRASLYQRGGAIGFRDQLQDAVNLLGLDPGYARERILDACRHQYAEGDVMHWWHPLPQGDRGLRSRCSDDLLWLPWALCAYTEATGDLGVCTREEPWLSSPPLASAERDRYESAAPAGSGTVLQHARAALERCFSRGFGPHGLPFFGSGDWNDAMDAADGESVWLGWFLSDCALRFSSLLDSLGEADALRYRALAEQAGRAAEAGFNGRWYRRGYWADGEPLGGDGRIDLLPQAFAAMSPFSDPVHAEAALDECLRRLVDREHGLVKLFDPPFTEDERRPGSITGYGRGVRENGGQYTHGALWLVLACLRRGRREEGLALLRLLLPTWEGRDLARYEAEPFALPADISSAPGREGQAGWTWYTGSAGWFWRIVTRELGEEKE